MPKSRYLLVPIRDQKFDKQERLELCPGKILGRVSLLTTFVESCGCRWKCPTCRALFSWATQFISREALRCIPFAENHTPNEEFATELCLQFRGQNTRDLLYVNNEKLDEGSRNSAMLRDIQQQQEWMGAIPLTVGTKISFRQAKNGKQNNCQDEEVIHPPLEFEVAVEQCQSAAKEHFQSTPTPQSLAEVSSHIVERNSRGNLTQSSPRLSEPESSNSSLNNSTPNMLSRLERRIEQDALTWRPTEMCLEEEYPSETSSKILPKQENDVISSVPTNLVAKQNSPARKKRPLQNKSSQIGGENKSILFVPLGRSLTVGRIQTLKSVVQLKGWKVVSDLDSSPSHVVVDTRVPVQPLARALGFKSILRLDNAVQEHGITLVKPSWITNNKGSDLKPPKLTELYNGLVSESIPTKKRRIPVVNKKSDASNDSEEEYICEVPATGEKPTRNLEISKILERLAKAYQKAPIPGSVDEFRAYTFHLVAGRLRCLDFDLSKDPAALEKLKSIKGIGESSRDVIREWLRTRQLPKRIKLLETEERRVAMCSLQKIWGVGPTTAQRLYMLDFIDINQIRKTLQQERLQRMEKTCKSSDLVLSSFLNRNQLVGIECYEDFQEKMSRSEVEQIFQICRNELSKLLPNASMEIMGSYRRGKQECGDADLLIFDPDWDNCTPKLALGKLVTSLRRNGHISYHLTETPGIVNDDGITTIAGKKGESSQSSFDSDITAMDNVKKPHRSFEHYPSSQTYMGVFCSPTVPGKRRRIDIKFYPYRERAFATLYFTGCGWFNRSMRLWSKRKFDLRLNDHGLFPHDGKSTEQKSKPHEDLPFPSLKSEPQIFEKLGLVFKAPNERNCFDDVVSKGSGESTAQLPIDDKQEYYEEQKEQQYMITQALGHGEWFNRDFFGD